LIFDELKGIGMKQFLTAIINMFLFITMFAWSGFVITSIIIFDVFTSENYREEFKNKMLGRKGFLS